MAKNGQQHCEDEAQILENAKVTLVPNISYRSTKAEGTNIVLSANQPGRLNTAAVGFIVAYGTGSVTDPLAIIKSGQFFFTQAGCGDICTDPLLLLIGIS